MYRLKPLAFFAILIVLCSCTLSSKVVRTEMFASKIVLGNNAREKAVLDASAFSTPNSKYFVRGKCMLNGNKLKVGRNSMIILDGGSLSDGEIVGDNTFVKVTKGKRNLSNLSFSGTFLMPVIKSDYFEVDETTLCDMFDLTSDDIKNEVFINDNLTAIIPDEWHGAVRTKSHTDVYLNATISQKTCSFRGGNVFYVRDCHDVNIKGSGHIIGDLMTHEGSEGESVYAIFIRNAENVKVQGVTCECFWGDGIYIYPGPVNNDNMPFCRNIVIDGVTCNKNRRQGISVVGGDNIVIKNSRFCNTGTLRGTAPSAGIDIEPAKGWIVDNITIDNCVFENNGNATEYPADLQVINNYGKVNVSGCSLNNFFYGRSDNVDFRNCTIKGRFYTSGNGIGNNVTIVNSRLNNIHNNLVKNGNVKLLNTVIEP